MNLPRNSCTYVVAGTDTFRLGSRKILGKWGNNMQNIEKSLRKIYIPDDETLRYYTCGGKWIIHEGKLTKK